MGPENLGVPNTYTPYGIFETPAFTKSQSPPMSSFDTPGINGYTSPLVDKSDLKRLAERTRLVEELFGKGHTDVYISEHCAIVWSCSEMEAKAYVDYARQRMLIETDEGRAHLRDSLRERYNEIYRRAMDLDDLKTALATLNFISEYEGLKFNPAKPPPPLKVTAYSGPKRLSVETAKAKLKELKAKNEPEEADD